MREEPKIGPLVHVRFGRNSVRWMRVILLSSVVLCSRCSGAQAPGPANGPYVVLPPAPLGPPLASPARLGSHLSTMWHLFTIVAWARFRPSSQRRRWSLILALYPLLHTVHVKKNVKTYEAFDGSWTSRLIWTFRRHFLPFARMPVDPILF